MLTSPRLGVTLSKVAETALGDYRGGSLWVLGFVVNPSRYSL